MEFFSGEGAQPHPFLALSALELELGVPRVLFLGNDPYGYGATAGGNDNGATDFFFT